MNESWLQYVAVPWALLTIIIFAFLYSLGGKSGTSKSVRRWVGGIFLPLSTILLALTVGNFHWFMVIALVAYPAALSIGYGGETLGEKFLRRSIFGVAVGVSCLAIAVPVGLLSMGLFQIGLAWATSVFFGIKNPVSARAEETIVGLLSTCLVPFMVL